VQRIYYTRLAFGGLGDDSKMAIMGAHLVTEADIIQQARPYGGGEEAVGWPANSVTGLNLEYTIIREGICIDAFLFSLNWFPQATAVKLQTSERRTSRVDEPRTTGRGHGKADARREVFRPDPQSEGVAHSTGGARPPQHDQDYLGGKTTGKVVSFETVTLDEYTKEIEVPRVVGETLGDNLQWASEGGRRSGT